MIVSELLSSKSSSFNCFEFLDQVNLNDIFDQALSLDVLVITYYTHIFVILNLLLLSILVELAV